MAGPVCLGCRFDDASTAENQGQCLESLGRLGKLEQFGVVQVSPLPFNRNGQIFGPLDLCSHVSSDLPGSLRMHCADKLMDLCDATRRKRGAAL
ncbi:hypothetical protein B586_09555 [Mycobacterium haemophilum DSM 44634]|nr:hypothetical protein B586_09555 [Mycobacterium haemophilum DSM 44634]